MWEDRDRNRGQQEGPGGFSIEMEEKTKDKLGSLHSPRYDPPNPDLYIPPSRPYQQAALLLYQASSYVLPFCPHLDFQCYLLAWSRFWLRFSFPRLYASPLSLWRVLCESPSHRETDSYSAFPSLKEEGTLKRDLSLSSNELMEQPEIQLSFRITIYNCRDERILAYENTSTFVGEKPGNVVLHLDCFCWDYRVTSAIQGGPTSLDADGSPTSCSLKMCDAKCVMGENF